MVKITQTVLWWKLASNPGVFDSKALDWTRLCGKDLQPGREGAAGQQPGAVLGAGGPGMWPTAGMPGFLRICVEPAAVCSPAVVRAGCPAGGGQVAAGAGVGCPLHQPRLCRLQ